MPFGLGEEGVKVLLSGAVQSELFEGYQQSQKFLASACNSKLSWLSSGFLTYPIVPELPSRDSGYWFLKERQQITFVKSLSADECSVMFL